MRLFTAASLTTTLLASSSLGLAIDFLAPLDCLKMKSAAEQIDTSQLTEDWMNTVCSKGCQPKVSDYYSQLRDKFVIPAITAEATRAGTSELIPQYTAFADSIFELAQTTCGASDQNLCSDDSFNKGLAKCIQANGWSLALANIQNTLAFLSANPCKKQLNYITNPDVLNTYVPSYMQNYAQSC